MGLTSILVVCTGNVCRSPSAEGFLRRELAARLGDDAPVVRSAGTLAWDDQPATPESVEATAERGVDIADHRARTLTDDDLAGAGLVLTMTLDHEAQIRTRSPDAAGRTFTFREFAALLDRAMPEGAPEERVAAVAAEREAHGRPGGDLDVADPLYEPLDVYRAMAAELEELSRRVASGLSPARAASTEGAR